MEGRWSNLGHSHVRVVRVNLVDRGGRWGSVARHVAELRGPCRPGGVGDGRVARCFHCCCRVESVPHGRDTADNLRESGGCSSFVEDKASDRKAPK